MRPSRVVIPVVASGALALAGASIPASPAAAATGGEACQVTGTATFNPGLTTSTQGFTYNLDMSLTSCQSNEPGSSSSGNTTMGQAIPMTVLCTNLTTGAQEPCTVLYQEPIPTGTGDCVSSTTTGEALVQWADGTRTVIDFTMTAVGPVSELQGTVVTGMALTLIQSSVPAGDSAPGTIFLATTRFAPGESVEGLLSSSPNGAACAGAGETSASVDGEIGIGSAT